MNPEGAVTQLSDHQQGSHTCSESAEGAASKLGHSLHRHRRLCSTTSLGMVNKITEAGVRRRAQFFYQQLDTLQALRQEVRRDLLTESRKPSGARIRAALLIALIQTPYRFRSKQQLWAYSGLALETHGSAEYRYQTESATTFPETRGAPRF